MTYHDRYGSDVLSGSGGATHRLSPAPKVPARRDMVLEDAASGFVGALVGFSKSLSGRTVVLEDRHGLRKAFPLGPGFLLEGRRIDLTLPQRKQAAPGRTASGSVAVPNAKARTARGSRIWVEGVHDAELVEKIWGDDLRIEGVVVEPLGGLDVLEEKLVEFGPDATHRVGVLADHLVTGSKETRIAQGILKQPAYRESVHIIGHPFIDIWAAVKPSVVGIRAWPDVPRGEDWKLGTLKRIGWPAKDHRDAARGWKRILGCVSTIGDVTPELSGRVEELIDFVTVD